MLFDYLGSRDVVVNRVDRLKTRVDFYSSFCITTSLEVFETINSPLFWEKHVVFREFVGRELRLQRLSAEKYLEGMLVSTQLDGNADQSS